MMQKASMNAVREVIERIESGALGIADAKVEVQMGQVEEALKEVRTYLNENHCPVTWMREIGPHQMHTKPPDRQNWSRLACPV